VLFRSQAATWKTAVAVASTDGIITKDIPQLAVSGDLVLDEGQAGFNELQFAELTQEVVEFSLPIRGRFTNRWWSLFSHVFGDDTISGAGPYVHTMNWQQDASKYGTLAWEVNNTDIFEIPSAKPTGVTIAPDGEGFVDFTFDMMGDTVNSETDDSLTNKAAAFDAVTWVSQVNPITSEALRLRINGQADGALDSSDDVAAVNWSLSIKRTVEGDRVSAGVNTGAEKSIAQPVRSGYTEITLEIELADYSDVTLFKDFKAGTEYKCELYWAKASTNFVVQIELGKLIPMAPDGAITGGDRVPLTRKFRCFKPASTPTGMATANIIHAIITDDHATSYV